MFERLIELLTGKCRFHQKMHTLSSIIRHLQRRRRTILREIQRTYESSKLIPLASRSFLTMSLR